MAEKKPCQYCGQPIAPPYLKRHEAACEKNPNRPVIKVPGNPNDPETWEQPKQEQKEQPIIISDVKELEYPIDQKAMFKTEDGITAAHPEYIGILHDNGNEIPVFLIPTNNGYLLPVNLIPGFIGMFPEEIDEPAIEQPQEPEQPALTQDASSKDIAARIAEEKNRL